MKIYNVQPINYYNPSMRAKKFSPQTASDLRVFHHHIYEYKKGIRNLILTTEKAQYKDIIAEKLEKEQISYKIDELNGNNINVYFGEPECVNVVKSFSSRLCDLTPEQDFILGIMLGYDRLKQCIRYNKIKSGVIKLGKHPQE